MNNDKENGTLQEYTTGATNKTTPDNGIVEKGCALVVFFAMWFFLGGWFTVGPRIAHNIENAVGNFILNGVFWMWIALPFTVLTAMAKPTKATVLAMGFNVVGWLALLVSLYVRWHFAYP